MKYLAPFVLLVLLAGCEENAAPLVGTLERDRIEIPAALSEPVVALNVEKGTHVVAGDALLQLDDTRALAELDRLDAERRGTQRRLDELLRGPRRERIREAEARLDAAEGRFTVAAREFERLQALAAENLASASALDNARAAVDAARGERDAARASLDALLEGTTIEELDQARAQLAAAEAAVRAQRVIVERLSVAAPRDAIVEALPWKAGSQPPAGSIVAVLLADEPAHAKVFVPVSRRAQFREGSRVTVAVPGFGDVDGRVRWLSAEAAFTPYYALTEHDRDRLAHAAEIELLGERDNDLPAGLPVEVQALADDE